MEYIRRIMLAKNWEPPGLGRRPCLDIDKLWNTLGGYVGLKHENVGLEKPNLVGYQHMVECIGGIMLGQNSRPTDLKSDKGPKMAFLKAYWRV